MTRLLPTSFFAFALVTMLFAVSAKAEEFVTHQPDDRVMIDLSGEDWVTTKTAHVTINVEAAVSASNAGTTRAEMMKAVNDLVKVDWRLTSFDRSQDSTGLERWSASFEARVPEAQLTGLGEATKKASKAGMQMSVGDIDFTPTLDETEATRASLRAQIYKQASDQLAAVNAAIPGRNYRIALVNFTSDDEPQIPFPPRPMMRNTKVMNMAVAVESPGSPPDTSAERAEKITLTAHVVFAAAPAAGAEAKH